MRFEDLIIEGDLPDEGPWRTVMILGEPVCLSEQSGSWRLVDGKLTPVQVEEMIPAPPPPPMDEDGVPETLSDGCCWEPVP